MSDSPSRSPLPHLRRAMVRKTQGARWAVGATAIALIVAALLAWQTFFPPSRTTSRVIDFSQSVEKIQELATVKTHLRFAVVIREESGNIIVRRFADQAEYIGMDNVGSVLFQDPTMFLELHGVATFGVRLNDLQRRITQDDSTVTIDLPKPELLDVKLIAADTRIVAQMKGLFRSSNNTLLLSANQRGEEFVRDYAAHDTAMIELAAQRARDVLGLIVQQSGKRAEWKP
ncbi:MAG: DUF4230 domain-containing protein [Chlorobi bacterium]|nr:MAG: hypothetical protein UZ07_CHB004001330 [Chlorobi bacterium OLB7]MBK8912052.1 DUF4230 domain-containing protein [Chlorobiota bacterium]